MTQAKQGDTVKVHYTGKLKDGTVFDASLSRSPLQFTIGKGQVIAGFEEAIIGMKLGEKKTIEIPPDKAYGSYSAGKVLVIDRNQLPPGFRAEVGQCLKVCQSDDHSFDAIVARISETNIALDANHPLAGKDLIFEIQLVEVISPA